MTQQHNPGGQMATRHHDDLMKDARRRVRSIALAAEDADTDAARESATLYGIISEIAQIAEKCNHAVRQLALGEASAIEEIHWTEKAAAKALTGEEVYQENRRRAWAEITRGKTPEQIERRINEFRSEGETLDEAKEQAISAWCACNPSKMRKAQ